jgi:hypothetical protein
MARDWTHRAAGRSVAREPGCWVVGGEGLRTMAIASWNLATLTGAAGLWR